MQKVGGVLLVVVVVACSNEDDEGLFKKTNSGGEGGGSGGESGGSGGKGGGLGGKGGGSGGEEPRPGGSGGSGACADACTVGGLRCADDGKTVLRCERPDPKSCARHVPQLNCHEEGYEVCEPPPSTAGASLESLCVNGCGVRGVPLAHEPCTQKGTTLPCAYWVCRGGALVEDRSACKGAGLPCPGGNEDCNSCVCGALGTCIGNDPQPCATTKQQCLGL